MKKAFDEHDLIDMMFESADIDAFKSLWSEDAEETITIVDKEID